MTAKPGSIQAVAIIWIISGILTIIWGFGLVAAAFASLIGIICLPLSLYPFIVGIFELVYGIKLTGSSTSLRRPPYFVSVLEITLALWLDVFGLIAGITTLILLNEEESKPYFSPKAAIQPPPT